MVDTLTYVGRRFVNLLVVLWIAGTLNFVIPRMMPGDPVEQAFLSPRHPRWPDPERGCDQGMPTRRSSASISRSSSSTPTTGSAWRRSTSGSPSIKYPAKVTSVIGPSMPVDARAARHVDDHRVRDRHIARSVPRVAEIGADPAFPRAAVHGAVGDAVLPARADPDLDLRGRRCASSRRRAATARP